MKPFVALAFACLFAMVAKAQDSIFVWTENRTLQWEDFTAPARDSSQFDAEVFSEVMYQYEFFSPANFNFYAYATFNKNTSWSKKVSRSTALLKHEQLHFDIAELYARKLQDAFEKYNYTSNFKEEILQIFEPMKTEYHQMQYKCDKETNHSLNKPMEAEWEDFIYTALQTVRGYKEKNIATK